MFSPTSLFSFPFSLCKTAYPEHLGMDYTMEASIHLPTPKSRHGSLKALVCLLWGTSLVCVRVCWRECLEAGEVRQTGGHRVPKVRFLGFGMKRLWVEFLSHLWVHFRCVHVCDSSLVWPLPACLIECAVAVFSGQIGCSSAPALGHELLGTPSPWCTTG